MLFSLTVNFWRTNSMICIHECNILHSSTDQVELGRTCENMAIFYVSSIFSRLKAYTNCSSVSQAGAHSFFSPRFIFFSKKRAHLFVKLNFVKKSDAKNVAPRSRIRKKSAWETEHQFHLALSITFPSHSALPCIYRGVHNRY